MRPDQHKKRKNAIYKKAHGIVKNKNPKSKEQNLQNNIVPNDPLKSNTFEKKIIENDDGDDEKNEELDQHFSRRKIESNWEKYERDPNERKEGDEEEDKSEDESAYNLEMSHKSKYQLPPPSWREVGHLIFLSGEAPPVENADENNNTKKPAELPLISELNNSEKCELEDALTADQSLILDLDSFIQNIKQPAKLLNGTIPKKASKSIDELEKDLDDLLAL